MEFSVYIAQSIDGFIAKKDGNIEWLNEFSNKDDDFGFSEFMNKIDAIIMGKNTFEKVVTFGFWPYEKPVYVLSHSLNKAPKELMGKVHFINGTVEEIIKILSEKSLMNIYVDGGNVIQSFLKEGKIDNLIITTIPIILGNGIPLFDRIEKELKWKLIDTKIYNNLLVKNIYKREINSD